MSNQTGNKCHYCGLACTIIYGDPRYKECYFCNQCLEAYIDEQIKKKNEQLKHNDGRAKKGGNQ